MGKVFAQVLKHMMQLAGVTGIIKDATARRNTAAATKVSDDKVPSLRMHLIGQRARIMTVATAFHTMKQYD